MSIYINTKGINPYPNNSDTSMTLKEKTQLTKQHISNQDTTKEILEAIGIEITPRYKFKDNPSMSISPKGYIKDFGGSDFNGGDVLDYLQYHLSINLPSAVDMVMDILNLDNGSYPLQVIRKPIEKKQDKEPLNIQQQKINKLEIEAKKYLDSNYFFFETMPQTELISLKDTKLFERNTVGVDKLWELKYLKDNILVYDNYYKCTKIILRDGKGAVVDMINYRPKKPNTNEPMRYENGKIHKYMQLSNEKKPIKRGDDFIYPFQIENEKLIKEHNYTFVGEGLKNALNSVLVYKVPFVSIESVSNINNPKIKDYILQLKSNGIKLLGCFDGDVAGAKAYDSFCKNISVIDNLLSFDSGIDFTDYLVQEDLNNEL